MKKYLILLLVPLLGWSMTAGAQRLGVREEVRADWNKSSGTCWPKAVNRAI